MKTEITKVTKSNVQDVKFGYWNEAADEFIPIPNAAETTTDAAKKLNCSPELLDAIVSFVDWLTDSINADLVDVWEKVNRD